MITYEQILDVVLALGDELADTEHNDNISPEDKAYNQGMADAYQNLENYLLDEDFREALNNTLREDGWLA